MKYAKYLNLIATIVAVIVLMTGCKKENSVGYSNGASSGSTTGGTTNSSLTLGSNSPVAAGSTLNLTASAISGATYYWTGPNSFYSTIQNPTKATFSTSDAGNYTCTATTGGAYGTTYTASISVASK